MSSIKSFYWITIFVSLSFSCTRMKQSYYSKQLDGSGTACDTVSGVAIIQTDHREYEVIKFKKGIRNGFYLRFNNKKNIETIGRYKNNLKQGNWKTYNENGCLVKKFRYKKGKKISGTSNLPNFRNE